MKTKLMALMLMAGGALFAETRVAIGVQLGGFRPAPPPVVVSRSYRPPCPGPGYIWVDGYYDPYGAWYDGYWDIPPYAGAYWVAPRMTGGRFVTGYWGGPRYDRYVERRGRQDFGRDRDFDRGRDRDHDRGRGHDRDGNRGGNWGFRPRGR